MTREQVAERLGQAAPDTPQHSRLSAYAADSVRRGRSNYPVSNLLTYCGDAGIRLVLLDMATLDRFCPATVMDVHRVLDLLMRRYETNRMAVYRIKGVYYTPPKSPGGREGKYPAPLSIKTLLAVCDAVHCDLLFEKVDEGSADNVDKT